MYKLNDVCNLIKGSTGIQKCKPGQFPLVVTAEERLTSSSYQFDCEAVCIPLVSSTGHGHASIKRIHYQSGKFALGSILCAIIPKDSNFLLAEYLYVYLSIFKDDILVPLMKGAANVSLSINSIKDVKIPIPNLHKQRKIISQYNVIVNSLNYIKNKNNNIINLTNILKQSTLNLAINGYLTNNTNSLEIKDNHNIFDIPSDWEWTTLEKIAEINGGYAFKSETLSKTGVRVIRISDFDNDNFVDKKIVRTKYVQILESFKIEKDNILIAMTGGTVGKSLLVPDIKEDMYNNQRVANIKVHKNINPKYIHNVIKSSLIQDIISKNKKSSNDNISMDAIKNFTIPLPTKQVQDTIVKKIEFLNFKCSEIVKLINHNNISIEHLLKTFLLNCLK